MDEAKNQIAIWNIRKQETPNLNSKKKKIQKHGQDKPFVEKPLETVWVGSNFCGAGPHRITRIEQPVIARLMESQIWQAILLIPRS